MFRHYKSKAIIAKMIRRMLLVSLAATMFLLTSCKPSPAVRVVIPNAKSTAQNTLGTPRNTLGNGQTGGQGGTGSGLGQSGAGIGNADAASGLAGHGNGTGSGTDAAVVSTPSSSTESSSSSSLSSSSSSSSSSSGSSGTFSAVGTAPLNNPYDGQTIDTPTGVTTVAAGGMYADMVLMMGGTLVATSEDNLSNSLYTSVFPAVSGIPGSMPANGQAMTTDQADALANMPAKSRPQAVVADSATFSGSGQAAETILNQAQIKVLVMEDTTGSPLTDAVFSDSPFVTILHNTYYIGQMLKDKCSVNGKSADAVATNFEDFYKNNVNGGSGSLHNQYGDYYVPPSTDAADFTKRHDSGYVDGFVLHPPTEQTDPGLTYAQFNAEMDSIIPNVRNPALDIGTTTFFPPIGLDGLYNQYFKSSVKMINSRSFTKPGPVGDTVANNYDFEMFCNQIIVTSNHTTDNQYTVRIPARACYGNVIIQIAGEIKLNLQPSGLHGVHTWLSGAPESVLEPLWLAAVYHPSDHSMGDFSNTLTKFYSTFFHHSLTPDELHQIMRNS